MRRLWMLLGAAAAVAAALFWLWPASPEARIRRELRELVAAVTKTGPEHPVAAAARAKDAAGRFVGRPVIEFDLMPGAVETRDDLVAAVFQARSWAETLTVETFGDEIEVDPGATSAVMRLSARATALRDGGYEKAVREFELKWVRTAEGWRIAEARSLQAIRPLP